MARPGFSDDQPIVFSVKDCKVMADGKVWLRYDVQGKSQHDFAADSEYQPFRICWQKSISKGGYSC